MLTLHRAALVLPDPADPAAPSLPDGAVLVRGDRIEAVGPYRELAAAHPPARLRDWGAAVLTPGLRNPYGHRLLERDYHPDPREEVGVEPVADGLVGSVDDARCGASARRGLQRMLGFGVTAVAGPFERAAVRTAVARSGLVVLPGALDAGGAGGAGDAGGGPLDPLAVLPLAAAVHGRVAAGGRADFVVFPAVGEGFAAPLPGGCLAAVLGGRLVYRRR
ncbi:imidazolonepropionase-like domain-containing protein [Kitasatospora sp. NPDC087314]|uniref:amidohydrolase family protein n=1 Tax=Kitasatospora sp. NPDC087314 TaxID=3364068 RepID=UPI0037F1A654